jgi:hypothetical protein
MTETKQKYTPETLMVYEIDTEKISKECNEAIHKKLPDEEYAFRVHTGIAVTLDPPALFDDECVGGGGKEHQLNLYGEKRNVKGNLLSGECLPRFTQVVTVKELAEKYSLGQMSLKDFMTKHNNWRPEHHRVGRNIDEWLRFYNKEE